MSLVPGPGGDDAHCVLRPALEIGDDVFRFVGAAGPGLSGLVVILIAGLPLHLVVVRLVSAAPGYGELFHARFDRHLHRAGRQRSAVDGGGQPTVGVIHANRHPVFAAGLKVGDGECRRSQARKDLVPGRLGGSREEFPPGSPEDPVTLGAVARHRIPRDFQLPHFGRHCQAPQPPVQTDGIVTDYSDAPSLKGLDMREGGDGVEIRGPPQIDLSEPRSLEPRGIDKRRYVVDAGVLQIQNPQAVQAAQRRNLPERIILIERQTGKTLHVLQRADIRDPVLTEVQVFHPGETGERRQVRDPVVGGRQVCQVDVVGERRQVRDPVSNDFQCSQGKAPGERRQVRDPVVVESQGMQVAA